MAAKVVGLRDKHSWVWGESRRACLTETLKASGVNVPTCTYGSSGSTTGELKGLSSHGRIDRSHGLATLHKKPIMTPKASAGSVPSACPLWQNLKVLVLGVGPVRVQQSGSGHQKPQPETPILTDLKP